MFLATIERTCDVKETLLTYQNSAVPGPSWTADYQWPHAQCHTCIRHAAWCQSQPWRKKSNSQVRADSKQTKPLLYTRSQRKLEWWSQCYTASQGQKQRLQAALLVNPLCICAISPLSTPLWMHFRNLIRDRSATPHYGCIYICRNFSIQPTVQCVKGNAFRIWPGWPLISAPARG